MGQRQMWGVAKGVFGRNWGGVIGGGGGGDRERSITEGQRQPPVGGCLARMEDFFGRRLEGICG